MRIRRAILVAVLLFTLAERPSAVRAGTIPLDYQAYDTYNSIRSVTVSDDGHFVAYVLMPGDGDPTLVIHDFLNGTDLREARGIEPKFTADSKFLAYTFRAPNDDINKARRAHKKPKDFPPNGLGIVDLTTGTATTVDLVKSVAVPRDPGNDTIAYLRATPMPSDSPVAKAISTAMGAASGPGAQTAPSPSAIPSPSPTSTATPSAMKAAPTVTASPDDLHKITEGNDLVVRDLANSPASFTVSHVTGYAVSHDGSFVAYATQTKDGKDDAVSVRNSEATATSTPARYTLGAGHYHALTFAPKSEMLAFATDAGTFANSAPSFAFYVVDASAKVVTSPIAVLAAGASGIPQGWAPSTAATPSFSKDTRYLYVGTAPTPTPVPSGTPEPLTVDIWNWHDVDLQSAQRHDADDERSRTYMAAIDIASKTVAQLGTIGVRDVDAPLDPGATYALGSDTNPYRRAASWRGGRADLYAVALADGSRKRIATELRDDPHFAPTGRFVAIYDDAKRAWFSVRLSDGKRVDLTSALHLPFFDELDDHPDLPPPYRFGGWLDGDRMAIVADRYDLWAVDPETGHAYSLTAKLGRKRHLRFSLRQLDPDATSYSSSAPITAVALDDISKNDQIWDITTNPKLGSATLAKILDVPKAFTTIVNARKAQRLIVGERDFAQSNDLYATQGASETFKRFSDANPQMAKYRLGTARLISYTSRTGVPLRGLLFEPTSDGSHGKRPMLVYFYERFSDDLHDMIFTEPAPGTSPNLLRYVSHGYVVFVPDIAYRVGHPGESAYDCMMPGVDAAIKAGNVDPGRVGIAGHSWAAYQIAYLLTRTNRFRAAEAGAAVANMTSAYGGIRLESGIVREFQYEVDQSRIGATPWDRTDLYLENSALFHVRNVHTPYLTIANDMDGAVPWLQGIEFFTALRRLDKEAYMFEFDGEDHNLRQRENQKFWTVHMDEFFDHFLLGAPEPAWMAAGVDFLHRGERDVRPMYGETP